MSTNDSLSDTVGIQEDDGSFQRKTFADIERDILAKAREEFGENVDLSQGSPIKQLLDVVIYEHERTWKVLEDLYYSSYYEDAYAEQLDKVLSLAAMERVPRRGATGEVTFSVNVANSRDVTIERGTVVTTEPDEDRPAIPFKTTEVAVLPAGEAEVSGVPIRAGEPWEDDISLGPEWLGAQTNVAANTITRLRNTVDGIDHVTNPYPTGDTDAAAGHDFVRGRDRETDAEFRDRYEQTLGESGAATLENIRASVASLDGVEGASIEENVTINTVDGMPPKSFRVTVATTEENYHDEIARAIGKESRAAGIESAGSESGDWISDDGVVRTEYFETSDEVLVYVSADITHDETYPDDGNRRVERAIIEYIGGETIRGDRYDGVGMGEDVIYDLVFKAAMSVRGVRRADVAIALEEPATGTDDIAIGDLEMATTAPGAISVSAVFQQE